MAFPSSPSPFLDDPPSSPSSPAPSTGSRAPPLVLYRLTAEGEIPNNRFSSISDFSTYSIPDDHNKYPAFRDSDTASTSAARNRLTASPRAFLNTPSTPSPSSSAGATPARGLVPYDYDPAMDFTLPNDEEDVMHDPKASKLDFHQAAKTRKGTVLTMRGFMNLGMLAALVLGMLFLFLGLPLMDHLKNGPVREKAANNIRVNGTGQAPDLPLIRAPVDEDTPTAARKRTGFDGQPYVLVYSDEFNEPGRTFYPGDDPYLEAMDFWYGVTGDQEWYDPRQVVTRDGAMVITIDADTSIVTEKGLSPNSTAPFTKADNHGFAYRSGMVQSWNKFCFTGGYIEVSVILPGHHTHEQYWPGAWTMGNLGRPGYPASTDAMWPYSYDECDVGTFPNQTLKDQSGPPAALSSEHRGWPQYDYKLSVLNGQRLSACTCPNSPEHPGPFGKFKGSDKPRYRGRGVPEIDIIEVQHNDQPPFGSVASQSVQFAPFTHDYQIEAIGQTLYNPESSRLNGYTGSPLQQAVSALSQVPNAGFQFSPDKRFVTYGFEYWGDPDDRENSFITWQVDGKRTVKTGPLAVPPDKGPEGSGVGQRLIPEEPMSIVLNLGISQNWGNIDLSTLDFPAEMQLDYIRIYQREGHENVGCSPPNYPTAEYIQKNIDVYTNWEQNKFKGKSPRNGLYEGGC